MDPTQALTDIRELATRATVLGDGKRRSPTGNRGQLAEVAPLLAEKVSDLDEWLSKGGFPPEQWRPRPGRRQLSEPGHILEGVVHGKRRSYDGGCRCLPCRAANRLRRNLTPTEMKEYESNA